MTTKTASIVLVALVVIGGLLLVALVFSASAGDAVKAALADDTYATSAQRSTTVCVGLFNFGCDTAQTSTVTAQRETKEQEPIDALELLLVMAAGTTLIFVMGVAVIAHDGGM